MDGESSRRSLQRRGSSSVVVQGDAKPLVQFLMLFGYLCVKIPAHDVFVVQNSPSVPTLVAVKWVSWIRRSAFIIDWHNFGYTLLALSLGRNSRFVTFYHWIEKHYGRMAHGSLCVTMAMQHELAQNWGINATVLYDQTCICALRIVIWEMQMVRVQTWFKIVCADGSR
ncbi:PREDICTED: UDP-glycosyltransferase TURAN-like [Ipomoea nil]|uniref:UDP-glycosyltransferase TURAN-like n=1 Tax=Ipomoea nil TaxID=35883 RepID=UPI000901B917|nr:PREDICTED: UDP-glycosyltransferase TURAN-like [Ipomoea nil]